MSFARHGSNAPEYSKSPKEAATRRTPFAFCWSFEKADRPVRTWLQVPGLLPFYPGQFFRKPNRPFRLL